MITRYLVKAAGDKGSMMFRTKRAAKRWLKIAGEKRPIRKLKISTRRKSRKK